MQRIGAVVLLAGVLSSTLLACGSSTKPPSSEVQPPAAAVAEITPAVQVVAETAAATTAAVAAVPFTLKNASFESQLNDWWNWSAREAEVRVFTEGGQAHNGSFVLVQQLVKPTAEILSLVVQNIPNPVARRITVKGFLRSDAAAPLANGAYAYIGIEFWRGGEKIGVKDSGQLRGSFAWTEVTVTADVPPEGAEEARIILVLRGDVGATGTVYFDDVSALTE